MSLEPPTEIPCTSSSSNQNNNNNKKNENFEFRAEIERNRQRALLKHEKRQLNLTTNEAYQLEQRAVLNIDSTTGVGGGFFVDDSDQDVVSKHGIIRKNASSDLPILPDTRENECDDCEELFSNSFLLSNFDEKICDNCHDPRGNHALITKTEAKQEYLLTDVDLEKREPALRYILKRNPRKYARSYMHLYLKLQVQERALEVHGSEESLEENRTVRGEKRESRKRKMFQKQIKTLRMEARSSFYKKKLTTNHEHTFGPEESYDNPSDLSGDYFRQVCEECQFEKIFEKM